MPRLKTTRGQLKTISCPRCGKKFHSETNILQHMNQLQGSCYESTLFEHFDIGEDTEVHSTSARSHDMDQDWCHPEELEDGPALQQSHTFEEDHDVEMQNAPSDSLINLEDMDLRPEPEQAWPGQYIKIFKGCRETFPGRKTFMDNFREDQYLEERKNNFYYPWVSKQEWEFASWLLRSGLSMAAIDRLLSLKIIGG
ncbi:hypothetical protein JVU11DRAFT_3970 [Chiua virens]|nr:hypothetical protein JVU11DRAFT_3970 [Chiua virens]